MKYVYTFQGSLTLAPTFIRACWHNFSDVCPYFFLSVPFAEHIVCLYQVNVLVWLSVGLVIFNFQIFQESLWCVSRACPIRNLSSLQYLLSNSLTAHIACTCRLNNNAHWQVNNNSTLAGNPSWEGTCMCNLSPMQNRYAIKLHHNYYYN